MSRGSNLSRLALAAKANLERLEVLLKDLSSQLSLYPQEQESFLEFEPDQESINGSREQLELDWMGALIDDETEPNPEPEINDDKTENQEISHREFVKLSSQVMPILESIFAQDPGKKLHLSYLHKAVNQKSLLGLSQDTVGLFLEEAIALGYCERDSYDKQCYYSVSEPKTLLKEALRNNPYKSISTKAQETSTESVSTIKPLHQLPPNPKVKMTAGDTIQGYVTECQPKTFTSKDVVNYLYSDAEQQSWSQSQKTRVGQIIRGGLSNYNNKNWKRIRTGVYKPLLPVEPKESAPLTETNFNHSLPPNPRVKMTLPDTIMGYIIERHPITFTIQDVVNYLYSPTEQKQWSKTQNRQVTTSINNSLWSNKERQWERIKPGVYKPLLTLEPKEFEPLTKAKPVHNLPPILNAQVNILAMIDNYIVDCKPRTFTANDILDYLYTKEEQRDWTKQQERKNLQAITGRLADYVNKKNWKRVRRGVYKPINY